MSRVRDLWFTTGKRGPKRKTARHPDKGGDPKAKRWLAVWADPSGKECTQAFAVKAVAEGHARRMEADAARGEYIDPAAGSALVEPLARKWLRLREVGAPTARRYEACYRLHVAPVFGDRPAGSLKPSEIAEWSRSMAGHPATRRMAVTILTGVLDLAVADKVRRDNPARDRVVGRVVQLRPDKADPWSADRVLEVARACGEDGDVVLTAAGLGLRIGECFGLAAEDIDVEAEVVHVRRQLACHERRWVLKLPKGGKTRDVPLPRGVAALFSQLNNDLDQKRAALLVTLPWLNEDGSDGEPVTAGLLFGEQGDHLRFMPWTRKAWKPALLAAGVIVQYSGHDYPSAREHGFHALRHWYSTHLLDGGVSLAAVMDFLGHSRKSAPLAIGVYGHVTPEAFETARQAVNRALFRPRLVTSDGTGTEQARAQ